MKVLRDWWLLPSRKGWVLQGNCCGKMITTSALVNLVHGEEKQLIAETLNSQYLLKFPRNQQEIELANHINERFNRGS